MRNPDTREHQNKNGEQANTDHSNELPYDDAHPLKEQSIVIDELILKKSHGRKTILNWLNNLNFWQD